MSEFGYGNLLSSVQKKIFPNGVAYDIMQRLDSMTVFNEDVPENLDAFDGSKRSVHTKAINLYKTVDFKDSEALQEACKESKVSVKVDSVETKYIADAEQTGSMSVYTFTDARGNVVSVTDVNVKECLQQEQKAVDNILQGVLDEIASGKIELPENPYEEEQAA